MAGTDTELTSIQKTWRRYNMTLKHTGITHSLFFLFIDETLLDICTSSSRHEFCYFFTNRVRSEGPLLNTKWSKQHCNFHSVYQIWKKNRWVSDSKNIWSKEMLEIITFWHNLIRVLTLELKNNCSLEVLDSIWCQLFEISWMPELCSGSWSISNPLEFSLSTILRIVLLNWN